MDLSLFTGNENVLTKSLANVQAHVQANVQACKSRDTDETG